MIDFHCHLDLYSDPVAVVSSLQAHHIGVLSVTTTPSAFKGTASLARDDRRIRTALGFHPELAATRQHELPLFETLFGQTRFIGEVGLDGSPGLRHTWAVQEIVFSRVLDRCVEARDKVVSVHSRRAAEPVLDMLEARPRIPGLVLHWFTGNATEVDRATGLGCWFGVSPAMLASQKGRQIASRVPRDRVVCETDGPFGRSRGELSMPWHVLDMPALLAPVWSVSEAAAARLIGRNEARLLEGSS